jgi:hypothetical protein
MTLSAAAWQQQQHGQLQVSSRLGRMQSNSNRCSCWLLMKSSCQHHQALLLLLAEAALLLQPLLLPAGMTAACPAQGRSTYTRLTCQLLSLQP